MNSILIALIFPSSGEVAQLVGGKRLKIATVRVRIPPSLGGFQFLTMPTYHLEKTSHRLTFTCEADSFEEAKQKAMDAYAKRLRVEADAVRAAGLSDDGIGLWDDPRKWVEDETQPPPYDLPDDD